jgi:hypothetical protein
MRNMCRHVGRQIYEIDKTHLTHTQASTSIENVYLNITSKMPHTQHIEYTTAGPEMCQIIWAYHLPLCLPYGNLTQALLQCPTCKAFLSDAFPLKYKYRHNLINMISWKLFTFLTFIPPLPVDITTQTLI